MKKKELRLLIISLPVLAGLAVASNSEALFGKSSASSVSTEPLNPAPALQEEKRAEPAASSSENSNAAGPSGATVSRSALGYLEIPEENPRNPFLTWREQYPLADPLPDSDPVKPDKKIEMPPGLSVKITYIRPNLRLACFMDGRKVRIGDSFQGGTVKAIEKDRVVVEFKNGQKWEIPMVAVPVEAAPNKNTEAAPASASEGKNNEKPQ